MIVVIFQINATDASDTSRFSVGTVLIQLQDLNDNIPQFAKTSYEVEIPEDSNNGSYVITITATDEDSITKSITYKLTGTGSDNDCFNVSPYYGIVTVSGECPFDVEQGKLSYFFTYQATDDGNLANTVLLKIDLTDENDNYPEYMGTTFTSSSVLEGPNFNSSIPVAKVQFTDADINDTTNGRIAYRLSDNSSIFTINKESGDIFQILAADYETKRSYKLDVIAEDFGTPSMSTNVTIEIRIGDENDNAPIFNKNVYEGKINETAPNGELILTVNATDADIEYQNQQIDYEIQSDEAVNGKFLIDRIHGEIWKSGDLDWDRGPKDYYLTIIATDRGDNPKSGNCTVHIVVLDNNDELPVLEDSEVSIREDTNVSSIVTIIKANDSDSNSQLEYTILDTEAFNTIGAPIDEYHNDHFTLNSSTGELLLTLKLDQEEVQEYRLTVQVRDVNGIKQTDSAVITIEVIDVPDEPPYFWKPPDSGPVEPPVQEVQLTEDVTGEQHNDSCIAYIKANDDDTIDPIYYFIVAGNEKCTFHLQNNTGCITVVTSGDQSVDREDQANYTLIVKASNDMNYELGQKCPNDDLSLKTTTSTFDPLNDQTLLQVKIEIIDENDNPPIFTEDTYTAGVTSTYNYGTSIIQLVATDKDIGVNAEMEYYIMNEIQYVEDKPQSNAITFFDIPIPANGWITLSNLFHSDDKGYFELDVEVVGAGGYKDTASVSIYLMNPNENQVKVVFDKKSTLILEEEKSFTGIVGNATEYLINIDYITVHLDDEDIPITSMTDMRIHGVNVTTNKVISYGILITAIDQAYTIYADLKNTYRVMEVVKAIPDPDPVFDTLNALQWFFFTFSFVLIFILSLWVIAFVFWRSSLRRKLKVANAEIYKNFVKPTPLSGTNKFAEKGNPLLDEEDDGEENEPSNASEASETLRKPKADDHIHENPKDDLLLILQDYDKSKGIANPAVEGDDNVEVTDV
ncbi:cadherin-23-like [Antedon mediterranea]|uniref:cadherin-23-like n=1 Tax=Antedon mediterranea TaxID=105859 RepID=UPI003AF633D0